MTETPAETLANETLASNFFIGINCFPGNDKYKFKRLLVSLLLKPMFNEKWYPETALTTTVVESPLMTYYRKEAEFIRQNLLGIPNKSLSDMVKFLQARRFELSTSNVCIEFLVDGLELKSQGKTELLKIIDEFKTFHPNTIVSGTTQHTSLTVNRNIFLHNHKKHFVCFCDDDDLSCSIDTKLELLEIYIHFIFRQIKLTGPTASTEFKKYVGSEKVVEQFYKLQNVNPTNSVEIMELTNVFRKELYDFLLTNPDYTDEVKKRIEEERALREAEESKTVKPETVKTDSQNFHGPAITEPVVLSEKLVLKPYSYATQAAKFIYYTSTFYGPHFFATYTTKHNESNISYGIWSLIIPPWTIDNFTNVKEVKNEDVIYDVMHHLIRKNSCLMITHTKPIYYYLSPSFNDYKTATTNDAIVSLGNSMMFGPNQKFKLSKQGFEYDSIVEYCRNGVVSNEFVADRDFRGYSVEDVFDYTKDFEKWNELIKKYDL